MIVTNHERICRMFTVLRDELTQYVVSALAKTDGDSWAVRMREALRRDDTYYGSGSGSSNLDVAALLLLITIRMQDCFAPAYRLGHGPRGYVSELRELRNKWAHQVEFENEAAARAIETANLLIKAFGGTTIQELTDLRSEIVSPSHATEQPRRKGSRGNETDENPTRSVDSRTDYVGRISTFLGEPLRKRKGSTYSTHDGGCRVVCSVSKIHDQTGETRYWFSIQPAQTEFLQGAKRAFIAFGCNNADRVILLPFEQFNSLMDQMNPTTQDGRHVHIIEAVNGPQLILKGGNRVDVSEFVMGSSEKQ